MRTSRLLSVSSSGRDLSSVFEGTTIAEFTCAGAIRWTNRILVVDVARPKRLPRDMLPAQTEESLHEKESVLFIFLVVIVVVIFQIIIELVFFLVFVRFDVGFFCNTDQQQTTEIIFSK